MAEEVIQHMIPPTFPMNPIITPDSFLLRNKSWELIKNTKQNTESEEVEGHVYFFDQFSIRLFESSERFRIHFPDIRLQGRVLMKVMALATGIKHEELDQVKKKLVDLGRYHIDKDIRPWQYGIYTQTLLTTIGHCLGEHASTDIMDAWLSSFTFILYNMPPPCSKKATCHLKRRCA